MKGLMDHVFFFSICAAFLVNARYLAAESLLMAGDGTGAARQLAALQDSSAPPFLRGYILLRRANLLDLEGKRDEALALYRGIEGDAAGHASSFLDVPFSPGAGWLAPLLWPRFALPD